MKYIHLLIPMLLLVSCERAFIPEESSTPTACFEEMWQTLDQKYSFFEYKHINWDSIYEVYRPKVNDDMSRRELFDVLSDMLYALKDGHTNLIAEFDYTRYWEWYLNYPQNFNFTLLERNYLGNDYEVTTSLKNKVIDSVGYMFYESFGNSISPSGLDIVMNKFKDMKGIIIDIRDNGGGNSQNGKRLASRFTDKEVTVGYEKYKTGPGHDDFSEAYPIKLQPQGGWQFTKKVVVLTNRSCYSASNDFVMLMKALPNVTIIGDSTGGGGGIPMYAELPNGWRYRFSCTISYDKEMVNIEHGIPPDMAVNMDKKDEDAGKDSILEYALDYLK